MISIAGGGDKGKPKENKNEHIDEENLYIEDNPEGNGVVSINMTFRG